MGLMTTFLFLFISSFFICRKNKNRHYFLHSIVLFVVLVFMEAILVFEHVYRANHFLNVMLYYHPMFVEY